MSWNFCTSGAVIHKAGTGASSAIVLSGAILQEWYDQAEAQLCAATRYDWVTNSGAVLTNFKGIIGDAISDLCAMKIINYDMSGYTSRMEAQTMLDVLRDDYLRCVEVLKDDKNKEKMGV
jgi:hypothetical protein